MPNINTKEGLDAFMDKMYKIFECKGDAERGILLVAINTVKGNESIDLVLRYNELKAEHYARVERDIDEANLDCIQGLNNWD